MSPGAAFLLAYLGLLGLAAATPVVRGVIADCRDRATRRGELTPESHPVENLPLRSSHCAGGSRSRTGRPSLGIAAALISAGFACALFGMIVTLAEANPGLKDALILSQPTGSPSGKSTVAVAAWLAVWPLLHWRLKDREVQLRGVLRLTWLLVAFGVLATFPPFYNPFATPG